MGTFKPCLDILPPAQRRIWPELRGAAELGFVLYGGTAIALRLGHRVSVDFDFFSSQPLDREAIKAALPFVARSTSIQDKGKSWSLLAPCGDAGDVKVSFFGGISFGRVGEPDFTDDGVMQVASLDDLMATKVKVVLQRAEAKDYRDVAEMIKTGANLAKGLAAARLFYGDNFQPEESLKALVYFDDGDLRNLSLAEKNILVQSVDSINLLPSCRLSSKELK
ncbi:MAG: nucleotidyl transferase AbiEii/AbiGii toxin family protein [Azoarcus sp.]|jgi:hypothetical protein|nr:nucleotidyl transferase AbiEii/AbiGii toxin family protein [Azoarcus sp.]